MVLGFTPNEDDRKDYRASPGYAKTELLSNLEFVNVLRAAGVHVTSTMASISWHGFFPAFAEGKEILSQASLLVKKHFGLQ
jgi:hypothetical protein